MVGKKVFIKLSNGREYTGIIKDVENLNHTDSKILLIDKFGLIVFFKYSDISLLQEESK